MSTHQSGLVDIKEVKKHTIWLEYIFNEKEPTKSTFRCRLCYKYYDQFGLQNRYKSSLSNEEGTLKKYKRDNQKSLAEHAKSPGHTAVVQTLQERSSKRLDFFQLF